MSEEDLLDLAWGTAVTYHDSQMYGNNPYYHHLSDVAGSVGGEYGYQYIAVAYLHDSLEDTICTEAILRAAFGDAITDAVVAMTKVDGESYSEYIEKVAANEIALTVKIHDTLCNLTESVKTEQWNRVKKYSKQLLLLADYK